MNPTTSLITGLSLSTLFVLSWLGSILYLRRTRRAMQTTVTPEQLRATDEKTDSIEDWLARAAALPDGTEPEPADGDRDQGRLHALALKHFPHIADPHPHLHLIGITGVEKRMLAWICGHTGLPNPFEALDRFTGDPLELRRAAEAWQDAHAQILGVVDHLCLATAQLHEHWQDPRAEKFFAILAEYLTELDALEADVKSTMETLRGLQAETALAEGTVVGLINLLIGSLGGYVVEAVVTAGTMAPAVAAQAQIELTWVLKQIARALERLPTIYSNTKHILESVTGFKGLNNLGAHFEINEIQEITRSIDAVA